MSLTVKEVLAAKGVHPTDENLQKLESKWAEVEALKGGFDGVHIDDADIAVRNLPGGDHVV